jgi:hypothetical protein
MQTPKVDFVDWFVLLMNGCVWKLRNISLMHEQIYGGQKSNMVFVLNNGMTNQSHSSFGIHLNFTYLVNKNCK